MHLPKINSKSILNFIKDKRVIVCTCILALLSANFVLFKGRGDLVEVTAPVALSNKVLKWGILRNNRNQPPAADPGAPELIKRYGGVYVGNTEKKEVFITFDEGYEAGYTSKILDVLKQNSANAVFFITGHYLKQNEALVRRMVDEGHVVGNHTDKHPSLPEVDDQRVKDEVVNLDTDFYRKFGQHTRFLRAPKGEYSERTLALTQKLGYINMFWSFAYEDWYRDKVRGGNYAYDIVTKNFHNGAIILLHAVSKDNADGLDSIIKFARSNGYEIGDARKTWLKAEAD